MKSDVRNDGRVYFTQYDCSNRELSLLGYLNQPRAATWRTNVDKMSVSSAVDQYAMVNYRFCRKGSVVLAHPKIVAYKCLPRFSKHEYLGNDSL